MGSAVESGLMSLYSLALAALLIVGSPYWLFRMATSGRYREGLWGRLGRVPAGLRSRASGRNVVWLHAVSVGEVLAATRLVREFEEALGAGWIIVVSTTTATGQGLARERFGAERVFWYPLDFAWAVRAYLRVLRPKMLVLMESELWPRMLVECGRAGIAVAVVNARVSDRSYGRGVKMRGVWGRLLRRVTLFLAQSEEDGRRLVAMGARADCVRVAGNLKYDVRAPRQSRMAETIREIAAGRPIFVAGSTVGSPDKDVSSEEVSVIQGWRRRPRETYAALLVLAPRHPQRFAEVESVVKEYTYALASRWTARPAAKNEGDDVLHVDQERLEIVVLDTIGDLAAVYGVADVAFVGGSLVRRGGHNPLEPAQFGVPVVMGPSFENFRDVVGTMRSAEGICIVSGADELEWALAELLCNAAAAEALGERGRRVFEEQQGVTARAVAALAGLVNR